MNKKKYNSPNISISKVYTKTGDRGHTQLVGGKKISKSDLRICSYGEIDELNSYVGGCRQMIIDSKVENDDLHRISDILYRVQNELFNVGNMLATLDEDIKKGMPQVEKSHIDNLEKDIDYFNSNLPALKSFVLPGGSQTNVWFHITRTLCRKCERTVVALSKKEKIDDVIIKYLNRLSDALFVWSRWINFINSKDEVLWNPNEK